MLHGEHDYPRLTPADRLQRQQAQVAARLASRTAERNKRQTERAADIVASLKAGVPLRVLGERYQVTMERIRQIARAGGNRG